MAVTLQQKRALFWGLGIVAVLVLVNLAWTQLTNSLCSLF